MSVSLAKEGASAVWPKPPADRSTTVPRAAPVALPQGRILLASRPDGAPTHENFQLEEAPVPEPGEGQVLLRTLYLSLDPYMRGRMSEGPSYAEPVPVGGVMVGGTVSRVEKSRHSGFREGDLVLAYPG